MAALVFAVAVVHALTAAQPLRLRVTGIRTTGQLATIEQLNLHVTNASGGVVRPSFTIGEGGEVTTFWHVIRGPLTLPAGRSADYTVVAPNFPAQPSIAGGFVVLAFSQGPAAVSSTGPYEPSTMHVGLTPNAVNKLVSVGRPVVVRAELLDQLDRPVHKANVPIFLGQIVYDQSGLELGEAAIKLGLRVRPRYLRTPTTKGSRPSPLWVRRQARTLSTFRPNLLQGREFYPYGYSKTLPIRFGEP